MAAAPGTAIDGAGRRDRMLLALFADARAALRSGPVRAYLALELVASAYLVARRGPAMVPLLAIIAGGALVAGILAWTAGRMPGAHPRPDRVAAPGAELAAIAVAYAGLSGSLLGWWPAGPWPAAWTAFQAALLAWFAVAATAWIREGMRGRPDPGIVAWVARSWWPFWPLVLAIALPKLPILGVALVGATFRGLASGLTQQVLLQVVLTARIEAALGRPDAAAVLAAVAFGAAHVAMDLPQAGGDWWIAAANAAVLQTTVGLVFCTAYLRHRAPLALGFCHALLMA